MAAMMLILIMALCIIKIYYHHHHCTVATFDFTTFSPGFLKSVPFLYSLAIFAWIIYQILINLPKFY